VIGERWLGAGKVLESPRLAFLRGHRRPEDVAVEIHVRVVWDFDRVAR
jgi:hypothetical protein